MSRRLDFGGRVAAVTGAASGMGRATAQAFAEAGARVVLGDVNEREGRNVVEAIHRAGGEAEFVACDVRREDDVHRLVDTAATRFGGLHAMVNNAAVLGDWTPIAQQSAAMLDLVFDVNVKGVVYGMKHALAVMRPQRQGVIVNVASVQGFRVAYPGAAF